MPVIPSSFDALLFLFADAFSAPVFKTFRYLVVGFLCRVGEHSVCGMLQGARLQRLWHHSRAHALFAYRKWCPDELGLLLLAFVVRMFIPRDQPISLAVDDSLFSRSGKKVYGAAWQYDGSRPSGNGEGAKTGYGNNWVIMTVIVRLPIVGRAVSLAVLSRLWQPEPKPKGAKRTKRKPNPAYPSKPKLAREMLDLIAARFPERKIKLVGDSAYATEAFSGLEERVMVTSRLKSNAALYAPKPPRTGKRGQPAKKGIRLHKLAQITDDPETDWQETEVSGSRSRTVLTHSFEALFYGVWGSRPVRVVLVRERGRKTGYQIALITMDMSARPAEIVEDYDCRWSIEVAIEDAKQLTGVGEARNRVKEAVERTVPFGLICQSLVICWYALNGRAEHDVERRRSRSPWYVQKRFPSYQDMLSAFRRANIAAQYLAVTDRTLKPQVIHNPAPALNTAAG